MNGILRTSEPGLWTLLTHILVTLLLGLLWAPLMGLRAVAAPVAEGLIRMSDGVHDALAERLER